MFPLLYTAFSVTLLCVPRCCPVYLYPLEFRANTIMHPGFLRSYPILLSPGSRLAFSRFFRLFCAAPERQLARTSALPSAPPAFSADDLGDSRNFEIGETIGEEGGIYALIGAQEPRKIGGRSARWWDP